VGRSWKPGDYYSCWWGFGDLPDLNFDLSRNNDAEKTVRDVKDAQVNIGLVRHLLDATEFWLKDMDVDGVRLDVPNEVPYWFWKVFNERVKKVKPDAYIVGELWGNASDYVRPGIYDAVMNYAFFRDPVQRFLGLGQGTAAEFDATIVSGRLTYPTQAVQCQMNLIDSHDTVRFLTQVGGNVNRLKLAAMFAMTYVGAPHIYYGDEIGMEGGRDPDCRRPFIWDYEKDPKRVALLDYYRKLTKTRHAHEALRTGTFTTVATEGKVLGYVRSGGGEQLLVGLNAGGQPASMAFDTTPWGGSVQATDVLSGETLAWKGKVQVPLPGEGGRIFRLVAKGGGSSSH
jgi:glycosidase